MNRRGRAEPQELSEEPVYFQLIRSIDPSISALVMNVSGTNFGKAASDYGRFRVGFPASIFDRLTTHGVGLKSQRIVDLGTGTGTLARGFALRACQVIGIDPDAKMIAEARQLDALAGVSVRYCQATAENTGLGDQVFDVVTAGQCWHWFDQPLATDEVKRILRPGGKLVIAHFDWLPFPGNVVEATEKLIERYNSEWNWGGGLGMYPQWLPGLGQAGMKNIETFSYDMDVPYAPEAWRGRIRASAGVAALDSDTVRAFDAALAQMLAKKFAQEILHIPHRVFAIIAESR